MAGASRSEGLVASWQRLGTEQRVAAVCALLLAASTLGPFSFVEAAQLLSCAALLALLKARADGRVFHLPFGDGTIVMAAGAWSGFLIFVRLFDRPLGQGLLALVCAAILAGAGIRERAKRPADDVPAAPAAAAAAPGRAPGPASAPKPWQREPRERPPARPPAPARSRTPPVPTRPDEEQTRPLAPGEDEPTRRLPPEDEPGGRSAPP